MAIPVPVTISTDFSAGVSSHFFIPLPFVPVPPTPNFAVEVPIPQAWPPGIGLGSVKKTSTVLHKGRAIIQATHDCGKLIPQITVPLNNALLPAHIIGSKREVIFNCFSVRMNGLQTACTGIWPPLPVLACGNPMSMPATFTLTNVTASVVVGFSAADFVGGLINTLLQMAIEYLADWMNLKITPLSDMKKALLGAVSGFIASGVQHIMDPRYPVKLEFKFKTKTGWEIKLGVSFGSSDTKNNPSSVYASVAKRYDDKATLSTVRAGGSAGYTWDAGGDTSREGFQGSVGASAATPVAGAGVTAGGEYHPDAPAGSKVTEKIDGKAATPFASGSSKVQHDDKGWSSKVEGSDDTRAGVHKESQTHSPDGKTKTEVTVSEPGKPGTHTVNTADSGFWGLPL